MNRKHLTILTMVLMLIGLLALVACGSSQAANKGPIKANWITPTVSGDTVTIPASVVTTKNNVHFKFDTKQGTIGFVAYTLNGATQVRARLCVPCQGESFTLNGDKLICDSCKTVFSAVDGKGIGGVPACQSYAKVSAPFTTTADGNITMKVSDLQTAFNKTLNRSK